MNRTLDFADILKRLKSSPPEHSPIDADLAAMLHAGPWSCDQVRDVELAPLVSKVGLGFAVDRSAWLQRFLVQLVRDVLAATLRRLGFAEEAHICAEVETVRDARLAVQHAVEALQPYVDNADHAYLAASGAGEATHAIRKLAEQVRDTAADARDWPMEGDLSRYSLNLVAETNTWALRTARMAGQADTLATSLRAFCDDLSARPEVDCHACCSLALVSLEVVEQMVTGEMPPSVALSLGTFYAGHCGLAAAGIFEVLDDAADQALSLLATAGLKAYDVSDWPGAAADDH